MDEHVDGRTHGDLTFAEPLPEIDDDNDFDDDFPEDDDSWWSDVSLPSSVPTLPSDDESSC